MLVVAVIGIGVNLWATRLIAGAERRSLNVEGAFRHVLTDPSPIATAIAGAVILLWGFERADGIASLLIAASMLWASYGLLRESGRIFMEAAPRLDLQRIGETLAAEDGVVEVHDLHVWEVTSGMPAISAHLIVGRTSTATRRGGEQPRCSRSASASSTPPSRWSRAARAARDRPPTPRR